MTRSSLAKSYSRTHFLINNFICEFSLQFTRLKGFFNLLSNSKLIFRESFEYEILAYKILNVKKNFLQDSKKDSPNRPIV